MIKTLLYLTLLLGSAGFSLSANASETEGTSELLNYYDVTCESYNYNYYQCALPAYVLDAWVAYEYSSNACIPNHAWGFSGNILWVDRGCRARFRVFHQLIHPGLNTG